MEVQFHVVWPICHPSLPRQGGIYPCWLRRMPPEESLQRALPQEFLCLISPTMSHLCHSFSFLFCTVIFMSLIVCFLGFSRWILRRHATLVSLVEQVDGLLILPRLRGSFIPHDMIWSISMECVLVLLPTTRLSMMVSLVSWLSSSAWVFIALMSS